MSVSLNSLGSGSNTSNFGNYVINDDCGLKHYNVGWEHPTIFLPFPAVSADGQILPMRDTHEEGALTDWIYSINKLVRGAGQGRRLTFDAVPEDSENYTETPYERIIRIIYEKSGRDKEHPLRKKYMTGGPGRGAVVPKVKPGALIQGALFHHSAKDYTQSPRTNIALLMPGTATEGLRDMITFDEGGAYHVPDLFNPRGQLLHFSRSDAALMLPQGYEVFFDHPKNQYHDNNSFKKHMTRVVTPPQGAQMPNDDVVRGHYVPWKNALRQLTVAAQLDLLGSAYDLELLRMSFLDSEFEDQLPAWLRRKMTGRGAVAVDELPVLDAPLSEFGGHSSEPATKQYVDNTMTPAPEQPVQHPSAAVTGSGMTSEFGQAAEAETPSAAEIAEVNPTPGVNPAINGDARADALARLREAQNKASGQ